MRVPIIITKASSAFTRCDPKAFHKSGIKVVFSELISSRIGDSGCRFELKFGLDFLKLSQREIKEPFMEIKPRKS